MLVLRDAPAFEAIIQDLAGRREPLRYPRQIRVFHPHVHAPLRDRGTRDPRTHKTRSDDPEAVHDGGRRRVGDAEILLQGGGREEDLHQLTGHVGDGELTEQLRLTFESCGHAAPQSVLDGVQGGEGGGIIASRLRQDSLPGAAEHEPPAEGIPIEQPAGEPTGAPSARSPPKRHTLRRCDRDVLEDCMRYQLVDDPQAECLLGRLDLPGEDHVERRARADQPRQALAPARAGEDAELDFRKTDLRTRVIRGDAVAAGERKLEPAAEACTVDPHRDRLREARDALQQLLSLGREPLGLGGRGQADKLFDVGAGDEGIGFARKEGDRLDGAVVLERLERGLHVLLDRPRDLVDRLTLEIERDDGDAAFDQLPGQGGAGGGRHLLRYITIAKPITPFSQLECQANCTSRRTISWESVVTSRVPVAPKGCPMAIDPPITLMMASLISQPFAAQPLKFESTCAANASCTSITPRSFHSMPARSSAFGTAKIGACRGCQPGSTAATA